MTLHAFETISLECHSFDCGWTAAEAIGRSRIVGLGVLNMPCLAFLLRVISLLHHPPMFFHPHIHITSHHYPDNQIKGLKGPYFSKLSAHTWMCKSLPLTSDLCVAKSKIDPSSSASSSAQTSCGWANGVPPKSRKAKNRALQKLLPNHNQPICKSYSKFTRFLLGYTTTHQEYPDPPHDDQITNLPPLTKEVIFLDNSVFTTYNATAHSDRTEWSPFKALLLLDLDNYQLGNTFTFEWSSKEGEKSRWNQVMIYFTVKHWIFAHRAFAFENFGMDCKLPDDIIQIGIVTRWVIGRIEEIKSGFRDQNKVEQRTRGRKRREVSFICLWDLFSMFLIPSVYNSGNTGKPLCRSILGNTSTSYPVLNAVLTQKMTHTDLYSGQSVQSGAV